MSHNTPGLFKELVRIEIGRKFPYRSRGRPVSLTFEDAYESILFVMKTGMQWRSLTPKTASYITVFKTMHRWMDERIFETAYTNLLRLYRRQRRSKFKTKGIAPCIGIGLRRYLSKHFIVADTPEHYTSQTCSGCLGNCGPFKELEQQFRLF